MYILFPTSNSSLDAYAYAGYVKYNYYLFTPHHLFSNLLVYVFVKPLQFLGLEISELACSKLINGFFQLLNLVVFHKILTFLKIKEQTKLLYILLLAFTFSLWRYSTENETYIVPITFSLLSSFYLLKYIKQFKSKYVFTSSFFGVVACLFHQIHFFWWLGLFVCFYIYEKKVKTVLLYLIPSILVPLSYILVLIFYEKQELSFYNLMHFVFNDLLQGSVQTNFGWKGVFFQVLNTFRTFFQLHPDIYALIKKEWVYILPFVFCSVIIFFVIRLLLRGGVILEKENNLKLFIKTHVFIFITNYLFAFYNYGNVEFMVMLPYNGVTNSY